MWSKPPGSDNIIQRICKEVSGTITNKTNRATLLMYLLQSLHPRVNRIKTPLSPLKQ